MTSLTQSYYCGESSSQIIYETIGNYFDHISERYPDGEALVVRHQGVRWTYAEFRREVDRLATGFRCVVIGKRNNLMVKKDQGYPTAVTTTLPNMSTPLKPPTTKPAVPCYHRLIRTRKHRGMSTILNA